MREFELIARHFAPLAGPAGLGLRDDAALLTPPAGQELVITTDAIVAGVHFFPDDPPETVGRKALAVNLSDLAAKGAAPLGFQLALMLPDDAGDAWVAAFARGLGALAAEAGCQLTGGDTVSTPGPLTVSITAFGSVPKGRMAPRGDAATGNRLVVTGMIGDGAAPPSAGNAAGR
jgi:thiamine-monophosphate kinase